MFTAEERKEYGFGTFEEDLKATNDECYGKGDMAWEDLEKRADGSHKSIRHGLGAVPSDLADVCCGSPGRCRPDTRAMPTLYLRGPQVPDRQLVTSAGAVAWQSARRRAPIGRLLRR